MSRERRWFALADDVGLNIYLCVVCFLRLADCSIPNQRPTDRRNESETKKLNMMNDGALEMNEKRNKEQKPNEEFK